MSPSSDGNYEALLQGGPDSAPYRSEIGPAPINLVDRIDFAAARSLHSALVGRRGKPVRIEGGTVTFAGALAAQVLLAAARDWKQAGVPFSLVVSPEMKGDLSRMGVLPELMQVIEVIEC